MFLNAKICCERGLKHYSYNGMFNFSITIFKDSIKNKYTLIVECGVLFYFYTEYLQWRNLLPS